MIGFVLTGHGSFPNGMLQSVELITGEIAQVKTVSFEENTDTLQDNLKKAIEDVNAGSGVVCFADLAGGTPFKVCSEIAGESESVQVIGGTNTPMLLSGVFQRNQEIKDFVKTIIQEGKDNIKDFERTQRNENSHEKNGI